jgi:hypothetical protein
MDAEFAASRSARGYFARGFSLVNRHRGAYGLLTVLYVSPALLAALLSTRIPEPNTWQEAMLYLLRSLTVVLGTLVVMVVVAYHAERRAIGIGQATWLGLHWVFRYLWTNAHTSLIFWVPTTTLVWLHARQQDFLPLGGVTQPLANGLWWIAIGAVALAIHTRTMLAPFYAVHSDIPGTLATVESWRQSGRHFRLCMGTLVLASAPVAIPLGLIAGGLLLSLSPPQQALLQLALPDLTWAAIQLIRPLLIPAVYGLYKDLEEGAQDGPTAASLVANPPLLARPLLALTRPLPHWGRWH